MKKTLDVLAFVLVVTTISSVAAGMVWAFGTILFDPQLAAIREIGGGLIGAVGIALTLSWAFGRVGSILKPLSESSPPGTKS